jgi:hypothetical protein
MDFCPHCSPCRKTARVLALEAEVTRLRAAIENIAHATAPLPDDDSGHENAFSIAAQALAATPCA